MTYLSLSRHPKPATNCFDKFGYSVRHIILSLSFTRSALSSTFPAVDPFDAISLDDDTASNPLYLSSHLVPHNVLSNQDPDATWRSCFPSAASFKTKRFQVCTLTTEYDEI